MYEHVRACTSMYSCTGTYLHPETQPRTGVRVIAPHGVAARVRGGIVSTGVLAPAIQRQGVVPATGTEPAYRRDQGGVGAVRLQQPPLRGVGGCVAGLGEQGWAAEPGFTAVVAVVKQDGLAPRRGRGEVVPLG